MQYAQIKIINSYKEDFAMPHNDIRACDACFHALACRNAPAAALWSYLCVLYSRPRKTEHSHISQQDDRLASLEKEGFILTTELSIKGLGVVLFGVDNDDKIICLNRHQEKDLIM